MSANINNQNSLNQQEKVVGNPNGEVSGATKKIADEINELTELQIDFSIKEKIETPESIEKIRQAFLFYQNELLPVILKNKNITQKMEGYHGLYSHTKNVVFRGICYAVSLGKDPIPVVFACGFHDLARQNDNYDEEHGKNAVPIAIEIMENEKFNFLSETQKNQIIEAISDHTTGKNASNYISACLWDADRTRLSWDRSFDEKFFNTQQGKVVASGKREKFNEFQNKCLTVEGKEPDEITPEEFTLMLSNREDLKFLEKYLLSPEYLILYDKLISLPRIQNLTREERKSFMETIFKNISKYCDISACLEILPSLIDNEVYDLEIIQGLSIREENKDIIKKLLDDKEIMDFLHDKIYEEISKNNHKNNLYNGITYNVNISLELKNELDNIFRKQNEIHEIIIKKIMEISKYVNENNYQYIKDCIDLGIDVRYLSYFNKDTKYIIQKYLLGSFEFEEIGVLLDTLHRRGHTLESVEKIFGNEKITHLTSNLLEFKEFDKFKDIGIEEFKNLSTEDKKIFLNSFISALTPKIVDILDKENLEELQKYMKIFREFDWDEDKNVRIKNYNNIIRSLLNSMLDEEREVSIDDNPRPIHYRKEYRDKNIIPPLVDDISEVLDIQTKNIKGRQIKVTELDYKNDLGISTHRFPSILSIEALEITDSKIFLASGMRSFNKDMNVTKDGYALFVKPRNIGDLYIQAFADIGSGNNSRKNIYNFEHIMLPWVGNIGECISLVPDAIKKELNLSQKEYTQRIQNLGNVTTLQEVGLVDKELELAIRRVIKNVRMYEGLITPTVMGIAIGEKGFDDVDEDILDYCVRRDIPLVKIKFPVKDYFS